jgi:DNA-binding response OmpR family regulator
MTRVFDVCASCSAEFPDQAAAWRGSSRRGPQIAAAASTPLRRKLLCIEDDRETAGLLAEDLRDRGYEVGLAYNGREGLSAVVAEKPDLVLCDLSMPAMSGFEVLERITAFGPRFQDMPFVFLTALTDRDNELRGRRLGADDYVAKPIDFDLLGAIIGARLTRVARMDLWRSDVELSQREREALTWSARGKTSDEIARILGLARRTVDFHLDNARAKLGVATRTEAVATAVAAKLIEL